MYYCLWSTRLHFRRRLPDFYGAVQAGGGDPLAVRAEGDGLNPTRVAAQDMRFRAGAVPNFDRAVGAAPGEPAVGTERHAQDRAGRVG